MKISPYLFDILVNAKYVASDDKADERVNVWFQISIYLEIKQVDRMQA